MSLFTPENFERLFQDRLAITQQAANADTMRSQTERMGLPSEIELRQAQAGFGRAQTGEVAADSASNRALQAAQARQAAGLAGIYEFRPTADQTATAIGAAAGIDMNPTRRSSSVGDPFTFGMFSPPSSFPLGSATQITDKNFNSSAPRYAKGTARVPGKGSGKVDSVPAMLAPDEAVLNKAAADAMGRGLIAALNAAGARKMGMV